MNATDCEVFNQKFREVRSVIGKGSESPEAYLKVLGDHDVEHICDAMSDWMGISKWMPSPKDLLDLCEARRSMEKAAKREPDNDHWRTNSYACLCCRDIGNVTIWHVSSQKAAIKHLVGCLDRDKVPLMTASCYCPCPKGQRMLGLREDGIAKSRSRYHQTSESRLISWNPKGNLLRLEYNGGPKDFELLLRWAQWTIDRGIWRKAFDASEVPDPPVPPTKSTDTPAPLPPQFEVKGQL